MRYGPLYSLLLALTGCGSSPSPARTHTLTVLAAASLTDAFTDLERGFEAAHPDVDVTLSFAGSQALATQIRHGLTADVFASADAHHIDALASEGLALTPRPFAQNTLVLAVTTSTPAVVDLEHLGDVGSLVVGADEAPVGRYTQNLLQTAQIRYGDAWRAEVESRVVSREPNVRLVLTKVAMGEADAAIVYATDVAAMSGVRAVPLPEGMSPRSVYLDARLTASPSPELADTWLAYVASADGRAALAARGFIVAPAGSP